MPPGEAGPHEPSQSTMTSSKTNDNESLTYASAGVSISSGNALVKAIKPLVASTARSGADAQIGGFGGDIDLVSAGYTSPPRIVAAIDGIGTKILVAIESNKFDTVGIDLVAMNVNDLVVQGAEPLGFLDYYACSKLEVAQATDFVKGVAAGCIEAGCALMGGETAEMPGIYKQGDFDGAGCAIGALARGRRMLPDKEAMREGDALIGLASAGCHSNGFSLIRKIVEREGLGYADPAPWDAIKSVGESLLTPTRIYVKQLRRPLEDNLVKGMAHITGGGLVENIPRMLPSSLCAKLDATRWSCPEVFKWLKVKGRIESKEFATTFNTGLGMVLVVDKDAVELTKSQLVEAGETVYEIGSLAQKMDEEVVLTGVEGWDSHEY